MIHYEILQEVLPRTAWSVIIDLWIHLEKKAALVNTLGTNGSLTELKLAMPIKQVTSVQG